MRRTSGSRSSSNSSQTKKRQLIQNLFKKVDIEGGKKKRRDFNASNPAASNKAVQNSHLRSQMGSRLSNQFNNATQFSKHKSSLKQ
jgi:hypothetical protein